MRNWTPFWAPDDRGAPEQPEQPRRSPLRDEGILGATMTSRLGDALHDMGPAEAADTGGMAVDPTISGTPTFTAESWLIDQETAESDVPTGGMADTWYEQEDAFRARRNDLDMGEVPHEIQTNQETPEISDEERWRP